MDGQEETGNDLEEAPKTGWKGIVRESSIIISSKSHGQAIWRILRDVWAEDFLHHSLFFHILSHLSVSLTFIDWSNLVCDKISEVQMNPSHNPSSLSMSFYLYGFLHLFLHQVCVV